MPDTSSRAWHVVFAAPPLALAAATVALLALGAVDRNPFWPRQDDMTIAEAAALRDPGSVAWMIYTGVDPNLPAPVRPGVLDDRAHSLTPGEAAVRADRTEVLATLIARGASFDFEVVHHLYCLAGEQSADESLEFLRARYPEWTTVPCQAASQP